MRDVIYLLVQLLTTLTKLLLPGGRTVIAENLILKQQLIIHRRSRQRAPNLSTQDRALLGFWSLFLNPRRNPRFGCPRIAQQISLVFGLELDKDAVRRVLTAHCKPDPNNQGPSWLTTIGHAKDSLWSRGAGPVGLFRCESILLKSLWVMVVLDQYTRRIIGFSVLAGNVDGPALCRMFNHSTSGHDRPKYLSSDNDPLFQYQRW
jgi:hypothetical protein